MSQLSLNQMHKFLSHFGSCFPWAICLDVFSIFLKKLGGGDFYEYFNLCLTMSAELMKSKFVCRLSIHLCCKLSLNLMHRLISNLGCCFPWAIWWDFIWIFQKKCWAGGISMNVFLIINMGSYESKHFKTLLLQITAQSYGIFETSEVSSQ